MLVPVFILLLVIAILVKLKSNDNLFYWSKRIGINNTIFLMPKIRTMNFDTPEIASDLLINPNLYYTYFGRFLRKTSLDELPQLYNIIIGEMSFVGPRPALFNQYDLIELRTLSGIHLILPGLTGWAQVNGRDEISITDKVFFDSVYLKNFSFFFDIKIIILTFYKTLFRVDVSH